MALSTPSSLPSKFIIVFPGTVGASLGISIDKVSALHNLNGSLPKFWALTIELLVVFSLLIFTIGVVGFSINSWLL